MKQDATWSSVSASYDPLELYKLMEKVILKQTKDQYTHSEVTEQIIAVYTTKQGNLTNAQWYEQFNTRVEVAKSVGVDFGQQVLWEYSAQEQYSMDFNSLPEEEQAEVKKSAEERHMAYLMIQNAGSKHDNLQRDLQNDFTKGNNQYPENRAQSLMFLDRYSKTATPVAASEGTAFTQRSRGKKDTKGKKEFDKELYKDRKCFQCGKKGHPKSHLPNKKEDADDELVKSLKSSSSVSKIKSQLKEIKKSFAQVQSKIEDRESDESSDKCMFQYNF
jgi:hypothetical protein